MVKAAKSFTNFFFTTKPNTTRNEKKERHMCLLKKERKRVLGDTTEKLQSSVSSASRASDERVEDEGDNIKEHWPS